MSLEKKFDIDAYMICPVRNATPEEQIILEEYKKKGVEKGLVMHYPATDTDQEDETTGGYQILKDHHGEISNSRAVHVFWNKDSKGSYHDLGSAMNEHYRRNLDILLINKEKIQKEVEEQKTKGMTKSFEMVLLYLDRIADPFTRIE